MSDPSIEGQRFYNDQSETTARLASNLSFLKQLPYSLDQHNFMSRCLILQLPNEVLVDIIHWAAAWPDDADRRGFYALYADRWALTRVCRRFYPIANPILYSRIALVHVRPGEPDEDDDSDEDPTARLRKSLKLLLSTLHSNPGLEPLCTELSIDVDACLEHLDTVGLLIAHLTETKWLRICDGFSERQFTATYGCLGKALASMPRLERLTFTAMRRALTLQHVLLMLSSNLTVQSYPNIKTLELDRVDRAVLPFRVGLWNATRPAPFTTLTLSDYHERPETIRILLSAPAQLQHFTYLGMRRFGYNPLDLRTLWSYLVPHMLTLETLRVGSLSHQTPQTPMAGLLAGVDFTQFGSLKALSLSYWATGADGAGAAAGLLAPGLERFEWVFDGEDRRLLTLEHFGKAEEEFLRELVVAAKERGVPLRKVEVVYTPTPVAVNPSRINLDTTGLDSDTTSTVDGLEYPWDRMDRLAQEFVGLGVRLTYNRPSVTREQFEAAATWPSRYRQAVAPLNAKKGVLVVGQGQRRHSLQLPSPSS